MKTLLVVTGASRGLGRSIALKFVNTNLCGAISSLRAVLLARSEDALCHTESLMKKEAAKSRIPLDVSHESIDLSNLDELEPRVDEVFSAIGPSNQFERTILINNAGDLGYLGSANEIPSLKVLRRAIDLSVTSSLWISSRFAHLFPSEASSEQKARTRTSTVVNISSLCAVQPFRTMSVYCAGKAARDIFHATMAEETKNVRVLNYAPGPLDTGMQVSMRDCSYLDGELKAFCIKSKEEGSLVQPADTAERLVKLVLEGNFKSGSHVDFYDLGEVGEVEERG